MKIRQGSTLGLCVALGVVAFAAIASSAHFVRGPFASLNGDASVSVGWKESGLGDTTTVAYTASAVAAARYQCVNRGGKCPSASNKEDVMENVSASGIFSSGKNGSIIGSLTFGPPEGTLNCPGGQVLKLVSASYANIQLTDTTNGVSAGALPSSLAQSGPECP